MDPAHPVELEDHVMVGVEEIQGNQALEPVVKPVGERVRVNKKEERWALKSFAVVSEAILK